MAVGKDKANPIAWNQSRSIKTKTADKTGAVLKSQFESEEFSKPV